MLCVALHVKAFMSVNAVDYGSDMNNNEIGLILGEIRGELKGIHQAQSKQHAKLESIDGRLRTVESKAARNGLVMGATAGVGVALLVETIKSVFTNGTPPGA